MMAFATLMVCFVSRFSLDFLKLEREGIRVTTEGSSDLEMGDKQHTLFTKRFTPSIGHVKFWFCWTVPGVQDI